MNKYDIDEQFLNDAWAKMRQQLDSELPQQKPWYLGKILFVASLAATLLLFTSYYFLMVNNADLATTKNMANHYEMSIDDSDNNQLSNKQQNFGTAITKIEDNNKAKTVVADNENEDLSTQFLENSINNNSSNNSLKNNKNKQPIKDEETISKSSLKNNIVKSNSVNLTSKSATVTSNFISSTSSLTATPIISSPISSTNKKLAELPNTTESVSTSLSKISTDKLNDISTSKNENNSSISNEFLKNNSSQKPNISKRIKIEKTNYVIELLPIMKSTLNNELFVYEPAKLETYTQNNKAWRYKKPISFGLTLGVNTNIKDASGFHAGLFANYNFANKVMLGTSVAYCYTAINTNYNVQYNVPVDSQEITTTLDDPMERSINDEINYNTNYQGINTKLMLSYFPLKRLSVAGGFFGKRYFWSNSNFDFLKANVAYFDRELSTNYGYNKYKAGPAFELQCWVKPKLNIAATFEMNLIPEVKQEFWASANRQDYLRNSFGVALQYQFN